MADMETKTQEPNIMSFKQEKQIQEIESKDSNIREEREKMFLKYAVYSYIHAKLPFVMHDPMTLKFVADQTPELCMAAVKLNGLALQHAKFRTIDICQTAVDQNSMALEFVPIILRSKEMCLKAVNKNGLALQFVTRQTYPMCLAAVTNNGEAWHFINDDITEELYIAAVTQDYRVFLWWDNPTEKVRLAFLDSLSKSCDQGDEHAIKLRSNFSK